MNRHRRLNQMTVPSVVLLREGELVDNRFEWVPFYEALADRFLEYLDKQDEFFAKVKKIATDHELMDYLRMDDDAFWLERDFEIDPFTVFAVFNRYSMRIENKLGIMQSLADEFHVSVPVPTSFHGIPTVFPTNAMFADPKILWRLFASSMKSAKTGVFDEEFRSVYEKSLVPKGNGPAKITMGLFWIRPNIFMPLDANSRKLVPERFGVIVPDGRSADEYIRFLEVFGGKVKEMTPSLTYPEISSQAWEVREEGESQSQADSIVVEGTEAVTGEEHVNMVDNHFNFDKNILLTGPPGTGKTYSTVLYAVAIIENKTLKAIENEEYGAVFERYQGYKGDGLIAFTTFHQAYSYEEFIEGIRPVLLSDDSVDSKQDIAYEMSSGVFKEFCDNAGVPIQDVKSTDLGIRKSPAVWKVSLEGTGDNETRRECLANDHIRIGWDEYGETISDATKFDSGGRVVLNTFYNRMQVGDIVFSCYSNRTIDAIGVVTGEPEWRDEYEKYKRLRKVRWLAKGLDEDIVELNAGKTMTLSSVYQLSVTAGDALQMLRRVNPRLFDPASENQNRVFIIDEINRGNISKIFGELITLIEPTKRLGAAEEQRAILPYSKRSFGVPNNIYIIGTMNSADRSIALMDTALRRRFSFVEMIPDSSLLDGIIIEETIDVARMLDVMNRRIAVLYDREHAIGHSYLLPLREEPTIGKLANIFEFKILPLLQEYFYDDYEKIQYILGDHRKEDDSTRLIVSSNDAYDLFGDANIDFSVSYAINKEAFFKPAAYAYLQ